MGKIPIDPKSAGHQVFFLHFCLQFMVNLTVHHPFPQSFCVRRCAGPKTLGIFGFSVWRDESSSGILNYPYGGTKVPRVFGLSVWRDESSSGILNFPYGEMKVPREFWIIPDYALGLED